MNGEPVIKLTDVEISTGRWSIMITGTDETGQRVQYVASADSYYTVGDGIWFGTHDEYVEAGGA